MRMIFDVVSIYNAWQKHESTLLHTYVLNEFLTADRRSVKIWAIDFYQSFSKNIVLYMNGRLSKNSFSTYVWSKVDSCFCEGLYVVKLNSVQFCDPYWNFSTLKCQLPNLRRWNMLDYFYLQIWSQIIYVLNTMYKIVAIFYIIS